MKRILIIDLLNFIMRAYYVSLYNISTFRSTKTNNPYNALFSFSRMLISVIEKTSTDYIVFCADSGRSFRKDLDVKYKATRKKMDEDLLVQIPYIKELLLLSNIHIIYPSDIDIDINIEADDIVGSFVNIFNDTHELLIVTQDRDYIQLIDNNISIFSYKKNNYIKLDMDTVYAMYGIYPHQYLDYMTIVGDVSDNISGIKGIGPKRASEILKAGKRLIDLIDNPELIDIKYRSILIDNRELIMKNNTIMRIHNHYSIDISVESLYTPSREMITTAFNSLMKII